MLVRRSTATTTAEPVIVATAIAAKTEKLSANQCVRARPSVVPQTSVSTSSRVCGEWSLPAVKAASMAIHTVKPMTSVSRRNVRSLRVRRTNLSRPPVTGTR